MTKNNVEFTIDEIFGDSLTLKLDDEEEIKEEVEVTQESKSDKLVKVTKEGIVILDDKLMEDVKRKNLSASMVSSFAQCPADWLMDSFILPKVDHEEPIHFVRGHIFHDTMEEFFSLDKEHRSPKVLSQIAMKVIKDKYPTSLNDLETMNWVKEALQGYLETGFEYKNVDVAQISKKKGWNPEPGLEIFVRGRIGNTTRDVVGFIDRVDRTKDGKLRVVDYKSGKKIYPFDPNKTISDNNNFGYWRQQLAYTMLLEQDGHEVSGAVLEFPIAKGEVVVDVENDKLREQVEKDFENVDRALNECIENNLFPFHGHFFCKWCGMLSPDHTASRYGKLNVSSEEVSQYVEYL